MDSRLRGNDGVMKIQSFYESINTDGVVKSPELAVLHVVTYWNYYMRFCWF